MRGTWRWGISRVSRGVGEGRGAVRHRALDHPHGHHQSWWVVRRERNLVLSNAKLGFHKATWINKFFPESSVLIICGILIGLFFFFVREDSALPKTLTPDIFFLFLLPPIIGEAGYFMPNRWDLASNNNHLDWVNLVRIWDFYNSE